MKQRLLLFSILFISSFFISTAQIVVDFDCDGIEFIHDDYYHYVDECGVYWDLDFPNVCDLDDNVDWFVQFGYNYVSGTNVPGQPIGWVSTYVPVVNYDIPAQKIFLSPKAIGFPQDIHARLLYKVPGSFTYVEVMKWDSKIEHVYSCSSGVPDFGECEVNQIEPQCKYSWTLDRDICVGESMNLGLGVKPNAVDYITGIEIFYYDLNGNYVLIHNDTGTPYANWYLNSISLPSVAGEYTLQFRILYEITDIQGNTVVTWYNFCELVTVSDCLNLLPSDTYELTDQKTSYLYDMSGHILSVIKDSNWTIRDEDLPSGMYFLKTDKGVEKIIKE